MLLGEKECLGNGIKNSKKFSKSNYMVLCSNENFYAYLIKTYSRVSMTNSKRRRFLEKELAGNCVVLALSIEYEFTQYTE